MPVVFNLYTEIARAAMNSQPTLACGFILAVLNKMVASAKRAETLIEYPFL